MVGTGTRKDTTNCWTSTIPGRLDHGNQVTNKLERVPGKKGPWNQQCGTPPVIRVKEPSSYWYAMVTSTSIHTGPSCEPTFLTGRGTCKVFTSQMSAEARCHPYEPAER